MQLSIIVSPKYERNISSSLTNYVRKKEIITVQNINNKKIERFQNRIKRKEKEGRSEIVRHIRRSAYMTISKVESV